MGAGLFCFPPYLFRMRLLFLFLLLSYAWSAHPQQANHFTLLQGGLVRGDSTKKELAFLFTADEWGEGLSTIRKTLRKEGIQAGFFFTGRFYRNPSFTKQLRQLAGDGHYLGPHSEQHLLYCDWTRRDSLLVTNDSFAHDIKQNMAAIKSLGLPVHRPQLFVPPYEWWNDSIAAWSREQQLGVISFTPGIRTAADYTWPEMGAAYKSSEWILQWLKENIETNPQKWNGAFLLLHAGTDPRRKDKFYRHLEEMIQYLRQQGFVFRRIDELAGAE